MVSVCLPSDALLQHLPSYLGFLLPWAWGISSRLLQQSAAIAPYLGWGVSPLCDPMDCSLPGSSIHWIFHATVLEWGAIAFSQISLLQDCNWLALRKFTLKKSYSHIQVTVILLDRIPSLGQLTMPALTLAINLSFFLLLKLNQSNKKIFSKGGKNFPRLWDGFI